MLRKISLILILFSICANCFAALHADVVWEVRTGGSETNGGGFKAGASGQDHTLQDAAQYSVTDGVTNGTTTITSATANFGTDVVGNIMYVEGGTGSVAAAWYEITSRTNSTTIVVDRNTGLTAGTGVTLKIGGALATPGRAVANATVSGHKIWVKSGTYTMSTATPGAGGPLTLASGIRVTIRGYQTTRGDNTGTRPVLSWGAVSAPGSPSTFMFNGQGNASQNIINFKLDGNDVDNVSGFNLQNSRWSAINCVAENMNNPGETGFTGTASAIRGAYSCIAIDCTTGFLNGTVTNSVADTCGDGFSATGASSFTNCIATDCTDDGLILGTNGIQIINFTAYSNGGDGIETGSNAASLINCVSYSNTGLQYNCISNQATLINCAHGDGTRTSAIDVDIDAITLSGDPFVDGAAGDFRPDNTAGEGALLRAAGIGVHGQTDNVDVGAVQHSDSGSSAVFSIFGGNIVR